MPDADESAEWSTKRREVAYHEARVVLETQQETASDVDDKALRTVQLVVVLVGVLASLGQLDISAAGWSLVPGLLSLLGSLVAGVITYSESDLYQGPNQEYLRYLAEGAAGSPKWEREFLDTLGEWIAENADEIALNGRLLFVTQGRLLVGVVLVAVAYLV
ncbi:hypothetical protein BRC89_03855 [Halobacteriales archaeon QS_4_70_19]|nr:MAG: hypothetical protein BRC89_03855 [Halobacteriales archaeon QS_4_70_19]